MASVVKNFRDGVITISDGTTPTANSITLAFEEGGLRWTEHNNTVQILDRGDLSHLRQGDEQACDVELTLQNVELLTSGANPTLYEAMHQITGASAWATTNDDGGGVYTLQAVLTITGHDDSDETVTFAKLVGSFEFAEGEPNTLRFSGIDFEVKPTVAKAGS